jgi:hypothetical protein
MSAREALWCTASPLREWPTRLLPRRRLTRRQSTRFFEEYVEQIERVACEECVGLWVDELASTLVKLQDGRVQEEVGRTEPNVRQWCPRL